MRTYEIFNKLKNSVVELDEDKAEKYAKELIGEDIDLLEGIEKGLSAGMTIIGDKFDRGDCFLPELIRAANSFNKAMSIIEPEIV